MEGLLCAIFLEVLEQEPQMGEVSAIRHESAHSMVARLVPQLYAAPAPSLLALTPGGILPTPVHVTVLMRGQRQCI